MSEAHDEIQTALDQYRSAHSAIADFEGKLKKAKADEADALTDDSAPETKVVSRIRDAQGLQQVYSRRLELAREKAAGALEPVREAALEYYWELNAKVDALVNSRRAAQFAAISARVDASSMHRALLSRGFPLLYPIIDTAADYAYDVLAAEKCRPRVVWLNQRSIGDATGLTLQRIEEDIARLKETEAAYEAEAAATYDFTPAPQQESQSTDPEPELAEQTA